MGNINIVQPGDKDFYNTVGPFLGRRDIYNELGYPIFVSDDKTFFVVDGKGICAKERKGNKTVLCNFFIEKEHRGQGLFERLLDACLEGETGELEVVAVKGTEKEYLKRGFEVVRESKNYTTMRRGANE